MRLGDQLNGYEIITPPTNAGGGMSQWAFARKGGTEYFLKMFLAPKYPLDHGPGSPTAKANKRAVCEAFEQRHLEIARRIDPSKPGGGNLVVALDFFRVESTYVKVMEKVRTDPFPDPSTLSGRQVLVILRSLAFSLRLLHSEGIVHGDLKPDNVLVQRNATGLHTAKLIDFDEAYLVGSPPSPEHIVGDPSHYSPELLRYIKRDDRLPDDALSTASDMFSLGLVVHALLVGGPPGFDRTGCNYPAEALLGGQALDTSALPGALQPMVDAMLDLVPAKRPTIDAWIDALAAMDDEAVAPRPEPERRPILAMADARTPALVGAPASSPPAAPPAPPALVAPASAPLGGPGASGRAPSPVAPPPTPTAGGGLRSTIGRRRPVGDDAGGEGPRS